MIMMTWFTPCSWPLKVGVLLGILGGGMPPGSPNPELKFQTKKSHFPHLFSDKISKIHTLFWIWPNLACFRLSDSWGDSPVFSYFIFVFALSQFSGPNYLRAWNKLGLIRQKLCHYYQVRNINKKILQMQIKFTYFYFVLIHLELKQ